MDCPSLYQQIGRVLAQEELLPRGLYSFEFVGMLVKAFDFARRNSRDPTVSPDNLCDVIRDKLVAALSDSHTKWYLRQISELLRASNYRGVFRLGAFRLAATSEEKLNILREFTKVERWPPASRKTKV